MSELLYLAGGGNYAAVKAALDRGDDIDAVDGDGDGVLRYAMAHRSVPLFQLLLSAGADATGPSTSTAGVPGYTILHAVAGHGWADGARLLISRGADVNALGAEAITPLMWAANGGHVETVRVLMDAGARHFDRDADDDVALAFAANKGNLEVVEHLLALAPQSASRDSYMERLVVSVATRSVFVGKRDFGPKGGQFAETLFAFLDRGIGIDALYDADFRLIFVDQGNRQLEVRRQHVSRFVATERDRLLVAWFDRRSGFGGAQTT